MSNDQVDTARTAIRRLNDQFRQTFTGGAVVITAGIAALDEATRQRRRRRLRRGQRPVA